MKRVLFLMAILAAAPGCRKEEKKPGGEAAVTDKGDKAPGSKEEIKIDVPTDVAAAPADAEKTASGLASKVLTKGTGTEKPQPQDRVKVHYTGWTTDGKEFDSSVRRGNPSQFGLKMVIPGWTEGLGLMVKGEKRRLWIPEELAYKGQQGKPQGMLVFDVELIDITPGPKPLPAPADAKAAPADATKEKSGLAWKVTTPGTGKDKPSAGAYVQFHFTAWQADGTMIQSSVQSNRPLNIPLEKGLPAWKEILPKMTAGQKVLVWSPQDLAFKGRGTTKPDELTLFELELISFIEPPKAPADVAKPPADAKKETSGLYSKLISKGTSKDKPKVDDTVEVHYSGWTTDGKMFDSSVTRGKTTRFPLKGVIPGWTEGVQLMAVGEKRRFWIPEELAYKGQPGAPAGMLVFDVELIAINPAPAAPPPGMGGPHGGMGGKPGAAAEKAVVKPADGAAKPADGAAKPADGAAKPAEPAKPADGAKPAETK